MGPYEVDYIKLFLSVLGDLRVIGSLILVFLAWALLRYVGVVFRKPHIARSLPKKVQRAAKTKAAPQAAESADNS